MAVAFDSSPDSTRRRLRKMTDDQLIRYGKACRHMASPRAHYGKRDEQVDADLRACIEEWRRRYPVPVDPATVRKLRERDGDCAPSLEELIADWPE